MVTQVQQRAEDSLAARLNAVLTLPGNALAEAQALRRLIQAEHELPEPARYEATLRRLNAWLALNVEDRHARVGAYERAIVAFPADYAQRRQDVETAVVLNALTFSQFRTLAECLPWLEQPSYHRAEDDRWSPPVAVPSPGAEPAAAEGA